MATKRIFEMWNLSRVTYIVMLDNGRSHGNRIMADMSGTRNTMGCDHPSFVQIVPLVVEL